VNTFLPTQDGEEPVNPTRRIIKRREQIDIVTQSSDPAMRRTISKPHHPRALTARTIVTVFAAAGHGPNVAR
jgi:hypothetical protein